MAEHELHDARPGTADSNATEYVPDIFRPHEDFARLVPADDLTKEAFHEVVTKLKAEPDWNRHVRQLIFVDGQEDLNTFSDSEAESSNLRDGNTVCTGHYCFDFQNLPKDVDRWIVGGGREDLPDQGVDFLLTLRKRDHRVHGRHGRFQHADSGAFMIHNDKRQIIVNQDEVVDRSRQLAASVTRLTFGKLTYLLKWTQANEEKYRSQLQKVRAATGTNPVTTPRSLELTPSERHFEYRQRYFFQAPITSGTHGTIIPGTEKKTGKAIVAKRVKRTRSNAKVVSQEIDIYEKLGSHPRICGLIEVLSSSDDVLRPLSSNTDDVYFILDQLMDKTFWDVRLKDYSVSMWQEVFRQVLEGVQYIHKLGIIHRDIKPANLLFSANPPRGVITDFGSALFGETSTDHWAGTIPFLAPEVMDL